MNKRRFDNFHFYSHADLKKQCGRELAFNTYMAQETRSPLCLDP